MASLLAPLGARRLARVLAWQGVWREHDPEQPHSHFGPLAVDAHLQGRGIGSRLMGEYTRRLDAAGQLGYLETDKPENVVFYERHGFVVTGEAPVLGNPNWFMCREQRPRRRNGSPSGRRFSTPRPEWGDGHTASWDS